MKPYQYTYPRIAIPDLTIRGVSRVGTQETTAGVLQGLKASDLEMRQSKSFDSLGVSYIFRARLSSMLEGSRRISKQFKNLPGEIEIDLLLNHSPVTPVFIDGEISHFLTYWQREEDEEKRRIVDEYGSQIGWRKSVRVPFVDILNQEASDRVARKILDGTYVPTYI